MTPRKAREGGTLIEAMSAHVAHSNGRRREVERQYTRQQGALRNQFDGCRAARSGEGSHGPNASGAGLPLSQQATVCGARWREKGRATSKCDGWAAQSRLGRVAHGVPAELDKGRDSEEADGSPQGNVWAIEPDVARVAQSVPNRVDRLRSLGNALVPQIAEMIGRAILKADRASTPLGPDFSNCCGELGR